MLEVLIAQPIPVSIQAGDGATGLHARSLVFNSDCSATLATITLAHKTNGLYVGTYTPGALGFQHVVVQLFTDVGFTTPALAYDIQEELLSVTTGDITSLAAAITALGVLIGTPEGADFAADIVKLRRGLYNRRRIDRTTKQLTLYADDNATPLSVFQLRDETGASSIGVLADGDVHEQLPL